MVLQLQKVAANIIQRSSIPELHSLTKHIFSPGWNTLDQALKFIYIKKKFLTPGVPLHFIQLFIQLIIKLWSCKDQVFLIEGNFFIFCKVNQELRTQVLKKDKEVKSFPIQKLTSREEKKNHLAHRLN